MNYKYLFVFLLLLPIVFCQNCILPYANFPNKEAVFLNYDLDLIEPTISSIILLKNEEIHLSCPGMNNNLLITNTALESAICVQNTVLKIGNKTYDLTSLNCSKSVTGEVSVTNEICGNDRGVIKIIGHNINNEIFDELFRICYDDSKGEAIYSEHILFGSAIAYAKKESSRPSFKVGGLGPGVNAIESYKQTTEKATFNATLQSSALADFYINASSYLARGHLAPDADFVYVSSQYSTYFFINTIPQWQVINNGNWKSIESSIRNSAINYGDQFRIWTGGHDVLSLKDTQGIPKNIYLSYLNSKLPVPKFTWKVVQNFNSMNAIAFVTLNNPFLENITVAEKLCVDICEMYGWNNTAYSNPSKGYSYCCDVDSLRTVIPTIPIMNYYNILKA